MIIFAEIFDGCYFKNKTNQLITKKKLDNLIFELNFAINKFFQIKFYLKSEKNFLSKIGHFTAKKIKVLKYFTRHFQPPLPRVGSAPAVIWIRENIVINYLNSKYLKNL